MPATNLRLYLKPAVYVFLTAVVLFFVGREMAVQVRELEWGKLHFNFIFLIPGTACVFVDLLLTAFTHRMILAAFGSRIDWREVLGIVWTCNLGKYVPGKIASTAGMTVMLARRGVRLPVAVASSITPTGLNVLIGLTLTWPLLMIWSPDHMQHFPGICMALLVLVSMVGLHPKTFTRSCNLAMKILGQKDAMEQPAGAEFMFGVLFTLLRSYAFGGAAWFLARSFMHVQVSLYPLFVSAIMFGAVASFVAFFTPAGIGVRESVLLLVLGPSVGPARAALVAVALRVIQTVVDVLAGGAGVIILRNTRKRQHRDVETGRYGS